jgi:hypothetical protein
MARTMILKQSLLSMPIPVVNPQGDGGAMDFQGLGDLAGRLAFNT